MIPLKRSRYLDMMEPFIDDGGMIKVLIGMRRCGKSTLMHQIEDLVSSRNRDAVTVYIDLDDAAYENIRDADQLRSTIEQSFGNREGKRYLFIDEIQNVDGFENVVEACRLDDVSVFITGSNSYLLSGELVTKLTGRYIEFTILPFSFSEVEEYLAANGRKTDPVADFNEYLIYGGLPKRFDYATMSAQERYVFQIIDETKRKDIIKREKVKNEPLLDNMISFIASVPSGTISYSSVCRYLRKEGMNVKEETVAKYLGTIFSSNIAYRCGRYDVVGKKNLSNMYKSYLSDPAIHTFVSGKKDKLDMGMLIENIVHNEFLQRGYRVSVGIKGPYEIDFVVTNGLRKAYVQVSYLTTDPQVQERESKPLLAIHDNYPKYIISMDPITVGFDGIVRLNLIHDFLLGNGFELRCNALISG